MPKKTKREKIIATYHKKLKLLEIQNSKPIPEKPIEKIVIKTNKVINKISNTEEDKIISNYFKIDLKKSAVIIAIILLLEFSLYFASINHYLKF